MTRITVACLDMAGTTIADDGTVMEAFSAAIAAQNLPAATYDQAMTAVRSSMGQSKIEVFRRILGDEETAQKANDAFEDHYAAAVRGGAVAAVPGAEETITALRQAGVRVCLATGFSPATRDAIIDKLVWGGLIDLALSPADAGFWGFEGRGRPWPDLPLIAMLKLRGGAVSELAVVGDTASDIESGLRAGAAIVAGVLTGASSRADLERAGAPLVLDTIGDILPYVTGLPAGGDEHGLGGQGYRDRRARGQRGGFGARLVDLEGDVALQQDADPGHRAEEVPGGDDPVAVLGDLHRQSFRPHEHVHSLVAADGFGRALTR
jgi:phosphoglycolate phosphatase